MGRKREEGIRAALAAVEQAARSWAETCHDNDVAAERRDVLPVEGQTFVLADILEMIKDADREVRTDPVPESVRIRSVQIEIRTSADGNAQSFLIMPGDTVSVVVRGYVEGLSALKISTIPMTITAHIV